MNSYEQKQEARRERILARADKMRAEGRAKYDSGFERLRAIPFGQPILVGHYSEKRDRNYRRKAVNSIDKGCEMPSAEIRTKLKKSGFRWSPSEGAWQRQLNNSAVYWAKELVKEIVG